MNVSNSGQRLRGPPPNGAPMVQGARPTLDQRNGSGVSGVNGASAASERNPSGTQMSRAEKFEDEKRRIIESCFGKKEPDGSISESYITHIRIEEDAAYPSNPPPRESPAENKKPRVIVVAVRKSGRVRMHKARENVNGTFSIGKTWNLDDLTVIESYTNAVPNTAEEQQNKQRAGPTGFLVTVQKPYYWNAHTAKEKDFFIFSLIKIYKKYTAGRLPVLLGFSSQELEQIGGTPGPINAGQSNPGQAAPLPNGNTGPSGRVPSQEPPSIREPRPSNVPAPESSRERRPRPSQERPPQDRPPQPSQERQLHSAVSHPLRSANSNDRIHLPGSFPSTDSIHEPSPRSSQPQLRKQRSESPALHNKGSQPDFRRPAAAQSTDSFRSGQESHAVPSGRSSNERSRSRQNGRYAAGGVPTIGGQQRSTESQERPRTAVKDNPFTAQDQANDKQFSGLNFNPRSSEKSLDQLVPTRALDRRNGSSRDISASSTEPTRRGRGPPSLNHSESSDHFPDETRPTTSSSHDVQPSPLSTQEATSSPPDNNVEAMPPQPNTTSFPPTPPPGTPTEEAHRPGLGPMIKKKSATEVASKFRKAATAYNAFRPRAPGVAEKAQEDSNASGDGITGVFQAPSLLKAVSQDDSRPATPKGTQDNRPSTPEPKRDPPLINITTSPKPVTPAPPKPAEQTVSTAEILPPVPDKAVEERRKKRRSDHSAKYAKALGINPSLLEGRTFEIEAVLSDFGWGEEGNDRLTFEELETGIRRELARVEAGSWLGTVDSNDDRVMAVGDMMDRVIAECEELDGLLTLYNVELGTLSEDVAYIEAQSQGLQVQTANQKLLQTELKNLLDTISISASQLQVLKDASLTKTRGVQEVEATLVQLYTAMLTIDPKLRHAETRPTTADQAGLHRSSSAGHGGSELSSMHAVRERREGYRRESVDFIQRLKQYLSVKFREMEVETLDILEKNRTTRTPANATKLDHHLHDRPKQALWMYSPLMLFVREIDQVQWDGILRMYESCAKRPYQDDFRDNIFAWKRITRKFGGEEQDVLFTTQDKETESLVGRKLTVKRAKTVRTDGSSRISSGDKPNDGKVTAYEAFAGALSEMGRMMFVEQNFVVDLFHASSLDTQDFVDAVATEPEQRRGGDLIVKKPFDPDRNMAKKVLSVMEEIYSFWPADLQSLVDWAIKQDALNGVGVLFALESQLAEVEETNQEFLTQAVTKVHDRVATQFARFVDEQVRGVEDTKVKIKKRKGVIAFMKTFPNFSAAIENMLPNTRSLDHLPIRGMVNDAYGRLNKAMFESLKFIAKESPTAAQATAGGDPEDKEALNYHILLIENMNHYIEEVTVRNNPVLEDWSRRAQAEMSEHMELYLAAVIRRPLGKLLDFVESTESLVRNNQSSSPATIATRASHSRSTFKKILSNHDAKEIRRGIETLKKRVEKHFGEGDDTAGLSRELVIKVCKECEAKYLDVGERVNRLVKDVYEGSLEVEWRREDIVAAFRK